MKITYYVHDLSFPLAEGIRKQAWWMAQAMRKEGHEIEIISTSRKNMTLAREGITVRYIKSFHSIEVNTDIMHYLSHPSPLFLRLVQRVNAKKQILTFFDGNCNGFWQRLWTPLLLPSFQNRIDHITYQTKYQQDVLEKTPFKDIAKTRIAPLIPNYKRSASRSLVPSLLFMSHLSPYKGIQDVLDAFEKVRKNIPDLTLTICDSSIKTNTKYHRRIKRTAGITFKGKVDSQEELSKAWIYLYPVHGAQETFSVPISLIESIQVGTAFISTKVGGVAEYFPEKFLIDPQNPDQLAHKIMTLLTTTSIPKMKRKIDNKETIKAFKKIYRLQEENAK
ncbi:glycosyltransferase family 4 protein [Candidatus Woesearchaeota archaeon]|nr:glycosyltransferase family 4 protein [Candidatus Woesearchaeota archaeon]